VALAALAAGCGPDAPDPRDLPLTVSDLDSLQAPELLQSFAHLHHDDARCLKGWLGRASDRDAPPRPPARATTVGQAIDEAVARGWCQFDPAPDIAREFQTCTTLGGPEVALACHCELAVHHLRYLHAARGSRARIEPATADEVRACLADEGQRARCILTAGTLEWAERCDAPAVPSAG
jgi:hypothetical protein